MYYDFVNKIYGRFHTVFMVGMILIAAIVAMFIFRSILDLRKGKGEKRLTKAVKIVSKRAENIVSDESTADDGVSAISAVQYYVSYLIDGDEVIELAVNRDTYDESKEGNTGYLMYQGTEFLAFRTSY